MAGFEPSSDESAVVGFGVLCEVGSLTRAERPTARQVRVGCVVPTRTPALLT